MTDGEFMSEAYAEALLAYDAGEYPVGAVVVRNGSIIGRAHNAQALLLSHRSSFSVHIHRMAAERGVPVEYVAGCPTSKSGLWKAPGLLAGPPIECT